MSQSSEQGAPELLPCPFCGHEADGRGRAYDHDTVWHTREGQSRPCRIAGMSFTVDEWNTRTRSDICASLVEALKPFAEVGELLDRPHGIYFTKAEHERAIIRSISTDDLRAARTALAQVKTDDK